MSTIPELAAGYAEAISAQPFAYGNMLIRFLVAVG